MEVAFEEHVDGIAPKDLAFMTAALNIQMREHYAPKWLEEPWPVKAYRSVKTLPVGSFWPIAILPSIDIPGAAGYHTFVDGLAYGRVRWDGFDTTTVTASHEALELRGDPRCNRWVSIGGGRAVALELCDPCEADTYDITVSLFGETRVMKVSDFLLPSYFVRGAPRPYTYLDTIDTTAHELGLSRNGGGYLLLRESNGVVIDYWGRKARGLMKRRPPPGWQKQSDPLSRVRRRSVGHVAQLVDHRGKLIS